MATEPNASAKAIKSWYTHLLKQLERKYSSTFDAIVKEIIRSPSASVSEKKKDSLKAVLSFLFTIVCTDDKVNLFEKLYHHNAQCRMEAIKYLVKNLEKMSFSDDSKGLLQNSIAERISDDSPIVAGEALKFETSVLIKIVSRSQLQHKLIAVLERTLEAPHTWESAGLAAIKHLTSVQMCQKVSLENSTSIFMTVLPFLLQASRFEWAFVHEILNSCLAEKIPFIAICKTAVGSKQIAADTIAKKFEAKHGLPPASAILTYVKSISNVELTVSKAFYAMLVLSHSIGDKCPEETSQKILKLIERFESNLKVAQVDDRTQWMVHAVMGVYPLNLNLLCITGIIDGTDFKPKKDIDLVCKIFEHLIAGMHKNRSEPSKYTLYDEAVQKLLVKCFPDANAKIEFLTHYSVLEYSATNIDTSLQVFAIEYLNGLLNELNSDAKINLTAFVRILSGLRSPSENVRRAAYETLVATAEIKSKYSPLITRLVERKEEIAMDANQLPLILHTILQKPASNEIKSILNEFIQFVAENSLKDQLLAALLLEALTHVNTPDILKAISGTALDLLNKAAPTVSAGGENKTTSRTLNANRSIIVKNILTRFTSKTIGLVKKDPKVWQTLLKSIESYAVNVQYNGKLTSVTGVTVSVLDENIFSALKADHQQQLIHALVNSATYCQNADLTTSIGKFLKQFTVDAKICIELIDQMAQSGQSTNELTAAVLGMAQKKRPTISSEYELLSPQILKSAKWKCGVTWLEFLQNRVRNAAIFECSYAIMLNDFFRSIEQTENNQSAPACGTVICRLAEMFGIRRSIECRVHEAIDIVVHFECVHGHFAGRLGQA